MQLIKVIYESACKAFIRFWDNRFIADNTVEYLKMQIEQLRHENKELQDKLLNVLMPKTPVELPDEVTDWKPLNQQIPWHIKRQQLEQESLNRARKLATEAEINLNRKTTEELEEAVGIK